MPLVASTVARYRYRVLSEAKGIYAIVIPSRSPIHGESIDATPVASNREMPVLVNTRGSKFDVARRLRHCR